MHDKIDELVKQEMQDFTNDGVTLKSLLPPASLPFPMDTSDSLLEDVLEDFIASGDYSTDEKKWAPRFAPDLYTTSPHSDSEKLITQFFNKVRSLSCQVLLLLISAR